VLNDVKNNIQSKSGWWGKDFGLKSAKIPKKHGDFNARSSLILGIFAYFDQKYFPNHLNFNWTLFQTCLGSFYPKFQIIK
jgi:hypothetical protein